MLCAHSDDLHSCPGVMGLEWVADCSSSYMAGVLPLPKLHCFYTFYSRASRMACLLLSSFPCPASLLASISSDGDDTWWWADQWLVSFLWTHPVPHTPQPISFPDVPTCFVFIEYLKSFQIHHGGWMKIIQASSNCADFNHMLPVEEGTHAYTQHTLFPHKYMYTCFLTQIMFLLLVTLDMKEYLLRQKKLYDTNKKFVLFGLLW